MIQPRSISKEHKIDLLGLRCSQMGPCARPQYCQGTKPEGEDPQVSYQEAQCQRTGSKLAFLWAWVGAIGQESFYTWSLSQSQFGERLFLSLKG